MRGKIFPTFSIIFFFIIFLFFYKGLENSNIYSPNTNIEKSIPLFETEILGENKKISSKDIFVENKFYLVNIWASWCVPCKDEHAFLMNLSKQKNIKIIGINYKDKNKNAINFLKELSSPYQTVLLDMDGTLAIEWGAYGVPETFLIYNKKIIKKFIGPLNQDSLFELKELTQ
jgi:cytochrome c biogenesis protein CcmG/thiol:disulfide interchange protein DsbE